MLCFGLSAFSFPFQMASSGRRGLTSWEDSQGGIAPGRTFYASPKKHIFLERFFSGFSVQLLAKMIPRCAQMCFCRSPGRRIVNSLLHFSPTLFFVQTIKFCWGFATCANVRWTQKSKKTSSATFTAFLAAHCQQNLPPNHNWKGK